MSQGAINPAEVHLGPWPSQFWSRLTLAWQFTCAGSVVLIVGMIAIGVWVTRQIEEGVTRNTAAATALYMTSFVEPLVQELAAADTLTPPNHQKLDALREGTALGQRIVSFKIWKEGGLVVYSSRKSIVGRTFETTPNLIRALSGDITAEFDTLEDDEDAEERSAGLPLLEMYSPLRQIGTGRIIAVAEFYETAEALEENLIWAKVKTWLVVGTATVLMLGLLSGIVVRGSETIQQQRLALEARVGELSTLLRLNEDLRGRVQRASRRTAEINERYLRRIGADLHDGPAQLLALASLRLDALRSQIAEAPKAKDGRTDVEIVRESLTEALTEIRAICTGLTLPELDNLSPTKLIRSVASAHERRTKTNVDVYIHSAPRDLERSTKICLYRFVQEGLSNSFRHGGGVGQCLSCRVDGNILEVIVSDSGPGFDPSQKSETSQGLGLPGLQERIESFGGSLHVLSSPGRGTHLIMRCGF